MTLDPDLELAMKLERALARDERLSGNAIDISVMDRVALLYGTVQSYRRKFAALEVAEAMVSSREVIDQITVAPAQPVPDPQLVEGIRAALAADPQVAEGAITIAAKAGHVTLQGNVSSRKERLRIEDLALGVTGVRDIHNLLIVDAMSKLEADLLKQDIERVLGRTSELRDTDIHVAVNASTVVLSGAVTESSQKILAERLVSHFHVADLRNEIYTMG